MGGTDAARRAALGLIVGVLQEHQPLSDQLAAGDLSQLAPAERARAQRLATTTLRHMGQADAVLKPLLRKAPPPDLRALLRLATVEILQDGAAPHGVVNAAVALARAGGRRTEGFTGLVNAVLRRVSEFGQENWQALPPPASESMERFA